MAGVLKREKMSRLVTAERGNSATPARFPCARPPKWRICEIGQRGKFSDHVYIAVLLNAVLAMRHIAASLSGGRYETWAAVVRFP